MSFHIFLFRLNHFNPNSDLSASKISHNSSVDSGSKKGGISPTVSTSSKSKNKSGCETTLPPPVVTESADRCSLCLFQFSFFRRPHHCRLCDALCCDECSKKRCLVEYSQVGQMNVLHELYHILDGWNRLSRWVFQFTIDLVFCMLTGAIS